MSSWGKRGHDRCLKVNTPFGLLDYRPTARHARPGSFQRGELSPDPRSRVRRRGEMARNTLPDAGPEEARTALARLVGDGSPGALWMVSGPAGSGRTALLVTVAQRCRRAGVTALSVPYGDGSSDALELLGTHLRHLLDRAG